MCGSCLALPGSRDGAGVHGVPRIHATGPGGDWVLQHLHHCTSRAAEPGIGATMAAWTFSVHIRRVVESLNIGTTAATPGQGAAAGVAGSPPYDPRHQGGTVQGPGDAPLSHTGQVQGGSDVWRGCHRSSTSHPSAAGDGLARGGGECVYSQIKMHLSGILNSQCWCTSTTYGCDWKRSFA